MKVKQKSSILTKVIDRLGSNLYQITGMLKALTWFEKAKYIALSLFYARSIIKTDRLLKVDEQMGKSLKNLSIRLQKERINVPFKEMEQVMDQLGNDFASLELTRELFGNNEYLRAFKKNLRADVTLDIGSNRGFFVVLAHKLLKSKKIICVEPQKPLQVIRHMLMQANHIPFDSLTEYHKFCSSSLNPASISINQIMKENKIEQIDFLKMDVEGAESDIFSGNLDWLERCKNITMEIHFALAEVSFIPSLLRRKGFQCLLTDLRGRPIVEGSQFLPRGCAYLYASSDNSLNPDCL